MPAAGLLRSELLLAMSDGRSAEAGAPVPPTAAGSAQQFASSSLPDSPTLLARGLPHDNPHPVKRSQSFGDLEPLCNAGGVAGGAGPPMPLFRHHDPWRDDVATSVPRMGSLASDLPLALEAGTSRTLRTVKPSVIRVRCRNCDRGFFPLRASQNYCALDCYTNDALHALHAKARRRRAREAAGGEGVCARGAAVGGVGGALDGSSPAPADSARELDLSKALWWKEAAAVADAPGPRDQGPLTAVPEPKDAPEVARAHMIFIAQP